MSSANNIPTEAILVDVELLTPLVEDPPNSIENHSTEDQPLQHNRINASSIVANGVKSYQSTATASTPKIRTISSASDESVLLPDVGYSPALSKKFSYVFQKVFYFDNRENL